jgi:hypothetical protein
MRLASHDSRDRFLSELSARWRPEKFADAADATELRVL